MDTKTGPIDFEVVHQPRKVFNMRGKSVRIILRLSGEPASNMVHGNDAVLVAKTFNQIAIIKRPRRIAMQENHDRSVAFVDVVHPRAIDVQIS